ncbi:hypothetical protein WJX82_011414 [Trebouxia sp. C0006]
MKPRVDEAIAAFIDELEAIPDQLIQQPAFKLRRQVKALRQVVSDLEVGLGLVVSTVDRAQVEAMFLLKETAEMPAQQSKVHTCVKRFFQMHKTLLAKTKALPLSMARPNDQTDPTGTAATPVDKHQASAEEEQRGQLGAEDEYADMTTEDDNQAESVVSAKQTGGSLERVRTATVNLRALTTPAVTNVKQMYQAKLQASERLLQEVIGSQQERNTTYDDLIKRALGTSAKLHKRALHLQRTCNAKDAFIAHQQAALESKDHATSDMQSTIARLTKSATGQQRIIAEQQAAIAALQVHITKLVSHEHSDKHKTHQQSSQVLAASRSTAAAQNYGQSQSQAEVVDWKHLQDSISAEVFDDGLTRQPHAASHVPLKMFSAYSSRLRT